MPLKLQVRNLEPEEIEELLLRNSIGRLAYRVGDGVDVEPVHYVYADGAIYGRTSSGRKLRALEADHRVAFEVDEVHDLFDWASVVVHGAFHRVPRFERANGGARLEGSDGSGTRFERAVRLLRMLVPDTLKPDDPTPHRGVVFRIPVAYATGRAGQLRGDEDT